MNSELQQALSWATWLGQHATPVFVASLLLVLVATTVAFGAVRRYGGHPMVGRWPRPLLVGVCLAIGAGVVVAMGSVFAEMLEAFDADEEIGQFDDRLALTLSTELPLPVLRVFSMVTHLGDPIGLTVLVLIVAGLLLARRYHAMALGWVVACAGGGVLIKVFKQIFERVRPVHEHGFAQADGFSFPSGHTMGSVVVYGMLAYLCLRLLPTRWHLPVMLLCTACAFSAGWSRVFLQVHWASDVVAGFALGVAWLTMCIAAIEFARRATRA